MHGDFSRNSFEPKHNFARVLMQQGRLIVDADWNEQSAVFLHYIRNLAADIIGWHGGPKIEATTGPFIVVHKPGEPVKYHHAEQCRYYVDGVALETQKIPSDKPVPIEVLNPEFEVPQGGGAAPTLLLIYLDLFESFVPPASKAAPNIDPALNCDTCLRTQINYRLRAIRLAEDPTASTKDRLKFRAIKYKKSNEANATEILLDSRNGIGSMQATLQQGMADDCEPDSGSGYQGLENQLYRIEVHHAGKFLQGDPDGDGAIKDIATIKWSRDNGSICYSGIADGALIKLTQRWKDRSRAIEAKQIVEVIIDGDEAGTLHEVKAVEESDGEFRLKLDPERVLPLETPLIIRRWDHRKSGRTPLHDHAIYLTKANTADTHSVTIPVEDGLEVTFKLEGDAKLFPGDYWLIPARAATGGIIWPLDANGKPDFVEPQFVKHHYAPIALIPDLTQNSVTDLRRSINPIAE